MREHELYGAIFAGAALVIQIRAPPWPMTWTFVLAYWAVGRSTTEISDY